MRIMYLLSEVERVMDLLGAASRCCSSAGFGRREYFVCGEMLLYCIFGVTDGCTIVRSLTGCTEKMCFSCF